MTRRKALYLVSYHYWFNLSLLSLLLRLNLPILRGRLIYVIYPPFGQESALLFFRKIWSQSLRLVVVNIIKYVSMPPVRESFYYFNCVRVDCFFFVFSWGRIRCVCFTIMYYTISSRNSASFFGIGKYLQPNIFFCSVFPRRSFHFFLFFYASSHLC